MLTSPGAIKSGNGSSSTTYNWKNRKEGLPISLAFIVHIAGWVSVVIAMGYYGRGWVRSMDLYSDHRQNPARKRHLPLGPLGWHRKKQFTKNLVAGARGGGQIFKSMILGIHKVGSSIFKRLYASCFDKNSVPHSEIPIHTHWDGC